MTRNLTTLYLVQHGYSETVAMSLADRFEKAARNCTAHSKTHISCKLEKWQKSVDSRRLDITQAVPLRAQVVSSTSQEGNREDASPQPRVTLRDQADAMIVLVVFAPVRQHLSQLLYS